MVVIVPVLHAEVTTTFAAVTDVQCVEHLTAAWRATGLLGCSSLDAQIFLALSVLVALKCDVGILARHQLNPSMAHRADKHLSAALFGTVVSCW